MNSSLQIRLFIFLVFVGSFAVFLPSVAPHITSGDSGELALAGSTLGIAHSPGYPVFVLVNKILGGALYFGNAAYRQNVACALICCFALFVVSLCLLKMTGMSVSVFVPLILLGAPSFRHQALVTEVFPLALLWSAMLIHSALSIGNRRQGVVFIAFLTGLGVAVHQTLLLIIPALFLLMDLQFLKSPATAWRPAGLCLLFGLIGVSVHLYILVRAQGNPALSWEDPRTWERFWGIVTRARYGFFQLAQGNSAFSVEFDSIRRSAAYTGRLLVSQTGWLGLGLLLAGLMTGVVGHTPLRIVAALSVAFLVSGPFFFWFAKMDNTVAGVGERFGLLPLMVSVLVMGCALNALKNLPIQWSRPVLALIFLGVAAQLFFAPPLRASYSIGHFTSFSAPPEGASLRWDLSVREAGLNTLRHLPRGSLLFSDRADETEFALAYLWMSEGRRADAAFLDCNAGVTRSIYGDDYYRIWGEPRLRVRERVESEIVRSGKAPVFYATYDPSMIPIPREPWGFLYKADIKSIHGDAMKRLNRTDLRPAGSSNNSFAWQKLSCWRFMPKEERARSLTVINADLMGRALFNQGNAVGAEKLFGMAQSLNGAHRFEQMGFLWQTKGQLKEAVAAYRKAVESGVTSAAVFANFGAIELDGGRLEAARGLLSEGLRHHPESVDLNYNLAILEWRAGRWGEAAAQLKLVMKLNPAHGEARRLLCLAEERARVAGSKGGPIGL